MVSVINVIIRTTIVFAGRSPFAGERSSRGDASDGGTISLGLGVVVVCAPDGDGVVVVVASLDANVE